MTRWVAAVAAVWVIQYAADLLSPYWLAVVIYAGINIILAVSLNLVNGFTGQFSMGHAGFMAVGAYTAAFLSTVYGVQSPALFAGALLLGGLAAALAGYVVGIPTLRLKGDYLAIATLGFGEIIRVVFLNLDTLGGARGMTGIPPLASFGWVFTWVIATLFWIRRLVDSRYGRDLLSVREDEVAAEAMGVDTTRAKVRAFVTGAFFAGIAGGLFAHALRYLNPRDFDFNRSFEIIIMVVLGGMGSLTGSVVAAVFLTCLREALRPLQELTRIDFRMIIYSLALILIMVGRERKRALR